MSGEKKGFFALAREEARRRKEARGEKDLNTYVLRCPDCGAPRQGKDLKCRFCGGKTTE